MERIIARLIRDFEQGKLTRRRLIRSLALATAGVAAVRPAQAAAPATALYIDHVSLQGADYARARDFYAGLLGMKVTEDNGKTRCRLVFGDSTLFLSDASSRPGTKQGVDYIAYTLADWDTDKNVRAGLRAELDRRGIEVRETTDSWLFDDPDGFVVQVGGKRQ